MKDEHKIHIAVDMMSGDFGLETTIPAIIMALNKEPRLFLSLVGDPDLIQQKLSSHSEVVYLERINIVPATQIVTMDDLPLHALRKKPNSSMRVALNLVKTKQARACVSAGNTGALMIIAKYMLRTIPGIDRPAILYPLPSKDKTVSVLDLGANLDCSAEQLFQFAVMGSVLVAALENKEQPTIGLLNVGSEAIKGTDLIKAAALLISQDPDLNYFGFVEGDDIYKGTVDLVVCDGFTGNVTLKVSEGLAKLLLYYIKKGFSTNYYTKLIACLAKPILKKIFSKLNPNKYNGASLLGLNGVVIKSHGGADSVAFCNAIFAGLIEAEKNVPFLIAKGVTGKLKSHVKV